MERNAVQDFIHGPIAANRNDVARFADAIGQPPGNEPGIANPLCQESFIFYIMIIHIAGHGLPKLHASAASRVGVYDKVIHERYTESFPVY